MFNENISEDVDVPSAGVLKLWFVLQDLYCEHLERNNFSPIELQKMINHYGDKYTHTDKVIMLIYGITTVKSFVLNEEKLPKDRFNKDDLSKDELNENIKELSTTQTILDTNIGELVIGYDYAYVRKTLYTPNVELTGVDKFISEDKRVLYNINYPYIFIDNHNQQLKIIPPVDYDVYIMLNPPKYSEDIYFVDIKSLDMTRLYEREPFNSEQGEETENIKTTIDIPNYTFNKNFVVKQTEENNQEYIYLVQEYVKQDSEDEVKQHSFNNIGFDEVKQQKQTVYQLIIDNHMNIYNIYWFDDHYRCEKLYLKHYE